MLAVLMPSARRNVQPSHALAKSARQARQPRRDAAAVDVLCRGIDAIHSFRIQFQPDSLAPSTVGVRLGNVAPLSGLGGSREWSSRMINLRILSTAAVMALVLPMTAPTVSFAQQPINSHGGGARPGGGGHPGGGGAGFRPGGGNFHGGGAPGPRFSGGGYRGGGGYYHGGGAFIPGVVAGAVIGGALASEGGYYGGPGYYAPGYYDDQGYDDGTVAVAPGARRRRWRRLLHADLPVLRSAIGNVFGQRWRSPSLPVTTSDGPYPGRRITCAVLYIFVTALAWCRAT